MEPEPLPPTADQYSEGEGKSQDSEREMRELEGQRDQLAGNRLALFWKEEEQNEKLQTTTLYKQLRKKKREQREG